MNELSLLNSGPYKAFIKRDLYPLEPPTVSSLFRLTWRIYEEHLGIVELMLLSKADYQAVIEDLAHNHFFAPEDQKAIDEGRLILGKQHYLNSVTGYVPYFELSDIPIGQVLVYWHYRHVKEEPEEDEL